MSEETIKNESDPVKKNRTTLYFLVVLVFIFVIRWAFIEPYVIPSESMLPTLLVNDHIFVNKIAYGVRWPFSKTWLAEWGEVQRGDVIVFRSSQDDGYFMVKRVVGLAGDRVSYTEKGQLIVNDSIVKKVPVLLTETEDSQNFYPVLPRDLGGEYNNFQVFKETLGDTTYRSMIRIDGFRWEEEPVIVPEGHLFVMGDFRDESQDSRSWGFLPRVNILGRASFVWLSCYETLQSVPYICDPSSVRWNRFFHTIR
ncbi:MAG: signal peptidase I [Bdellovibrionales bacterium]|nr:signal peptidase I [Bdellovibrionales bacterium]